MKRIVYTRPDGELSIIIPTGEVDLARVLMRDLPADAVEWWECEASNIPTDRTFRDAWCRGDGKSIDVDMPKARTIHMGRIRQVRDAELARLDIEQLKGNDVAAQKQKLRDIPQTFDLTVAATPGELKALWPADLPTTVSK